MNVQRLSVWTALRCRESDFQRFLDVTSEEEAAKKVRAICRIQSRAELDTNADAAQRLHDQIRKPYSAFLERERDEAFQQ